MKKIILITITLLFTYNCAITAGTKKMIVNDYNSQNRLNEPIHIMESTGGSITIPFWVSKISDENFTIAIEESILNSKLFAEIDEDSDYKLKVEIIDLDHPWFGGDLTVTLFVNYTLFYKGDIIFKKSITSEGTATISEMLLGVYRLRRANQYAAKKNIQILIQELETELSKKSNNLKDKISLNY
ncbi:MAG: hypothetical protein KDK36_01570 [Leptospiraceae bacterium]|nr:hypothetical protein [Leptospiraceae bacterium]